jgi:hypothetical protein
MGNPPPFDLALVKELVTLNYLTHTVSNDDHPTLDSPVSKLLKIGQ